MTPEQWNGFFIGGGVVLLVVLAVIAVLATITATKLVKHGLQMYRRAGLVNLDQDREGNVVVKYEGRERFQEGVHATTSVFDPSRLTDSFPDLANARDERERRDRDPEAGGKERT